LPAGLFDVEILEPENRGHGTLTGRHRGLHQFAAVFHQIHRGPEFQSPGGRECREFAEAVARHQPWLSSAALAPQAIGRDAGRQHCGLRALRGVEQLGGSVLASTPKIVAQHGRGLGKGRFDQRRNPRQRAHHADGL
jgi:hypothetical protein